MDIVFLVSELLQIKLKSRDRHSFPLGFSAMEIDMVVLVAAHSSAVRKFQKSIQESKFSLF